MSLSAPHCCPSFSRNFIGSRRLRSFGSHLSLTMAAMEELEIHSKVTCPLFSCEGPANTLVC